VTWDDLKFLAVAFGLAISFGLGFKLGVERSLEYLDELRRRRGK